MEAINVVHSMLLFKGPCRLLWCLLLVCWNPWLCCQALFEGDDGDTALLMPFLQPKTPTVNIAALHRSAAKKELAKANEGDLPVSSGAAFWASQQVDKLDKGADQDALYQLYDDLLSSSYRKYVRPMPSCSQSGCSGRTKVKLGMRVVQILGLNPDDSTLSVQVVLAMMWADPRLSFDASKYFKNSSWDSLKHCLSIPVADIWFPDIAVANTATPSSSLFTDPNALLYDGTKLEHDGYNVKLIQSAILRVKCPVDLKDFPEDSQACPIIFRSSSNTGWFNLTRLREEHEIDSSTLQNLVNTRDEYDVLSIIGRDTVYNCPDSGLEVPEIMYTIRLRRRPEYYVLNVVIPLQILSLLSVGSLYLAPGASRVAYGVTLVLTVMSVTFFMGSFLPRTGGGDTMLESYEQNVYMAVITPVFFSLFTEVYCRIRRRSPGFNDEDENQLKENVERVDTFARIIFGCAIGGWVIKMAVERIILAVNGVRFNVLPIKVYNISLAILIIVVVIGDIRGLILRSSMK